MIIVDSSGPIAPRWYHWDDVLRQEMLADGLAIIAFIHNRMGQRWLGGHLREHHLKDGTLMTLACGQDDRDAGAFIAAACVNFGGEAPSRAAQSLGGVATVFFNAPAAC